MCNGAQSVEILHIPSNARASKWIERERARGERKDIVCVYERECGCVCMLFTAVFGACVLIALESKFKASRPCIFFHSNRFESQNSFRQTTFVTTHNDNYLKQ